MLQNGEILQLCERGTHWVAKVVLLIDNVYELLNVELKTGEINNGRLVDSAKQSVIDRARLMV